jgi:hypothetical protein
MLAMPPDGRSMEIPSAAAHTGRWRRAKAVRNKANPHDPGIQFLRRPGRPAERSAAAGRREMLDWHGSGMSVMEMSHRGPEFISIYKQAEADLRELLACPSNYKVLFMQGGGLGRTPSSR